MSELNQYRSILVMFKDFKVPGLKNKTLRKLKILGVLPV
jgi:hypothetical protein